MSLCDNTLFVIVRRLPARFAIQACRLVCRQWRACVQSAFGFLWPLPCDGPSYCVHLISFGGPVPFRDLVADLGLTPGFEECVTAAVVLGNHAAFLDLWDIFATRFARGGWSGPAALAPLTAVGIRVLEARPEQLREYLLMCHHFCENENNHLHKERSRRRAAFLADGDVDYREVVNVQIDPWLGLLLVRIAVRAIERSDMNALETLYGMGLPDSAGFVIILVETAIRCCHKTALRWLCERQFLSSGRTAPAPATMLPLLAELGEGSSECELQAKYGNYENFATLVALGADPCCSLCCAARAGQLDFITRAVQSGHSCHPHIYGVCLEGADRQTALRTVLALHAQYPRLVPPCTWDACASAWNYPEALGLLLDHMEPGAESWKVPETAARANSVSSLQLALKRGCRPGNTLAMAIRSNSYEAAVVACAYRLPLTCVWATLARIIGRRERRRYLRLLADFGVSAARAELYFEARQDIARGLVYDASAVDTTEEDDWE